MNLKHLKAYFKKKENLKMIPKGPVFSFHLVNLVFIILSRCHDLCIPSLCYE